MFYFKKGITWSLFGFENFGVRFKDYGYVFDVSGSSMFPEEEDLYYVIGYLCSNVCFKFLSCLAPTVNFQVGNIASLPFKIEKNEKIRERIDVLVKENIEICKEEWNFYETSIEFKAHPFVMKKFKKDNIEKTLINFENYYNKLRDNLRKNEIELNKIYSNIFGLENEIENNVNDRDLTIKPLKKDEFIKLFLSYIVGCSVGRYNYKNCNVFLEKSNYKININSILNTLEKVLVYMFGKDSYENNISYIKNVLNLKSIEKYFEKDFLKNHEKQYQNHKIYNF